MLCRSLLLSINLIPGGQIINKRLNSKLEVDEFQGEESVSLQVCNGRKATSEGGSREIS